MRKGTKPKPPLVPPKPTGPLIHVLPYPFGERTAKPRTKAEHGLLNFLEMGVKITRQMPDKVGGFSSLDDFLLQRGAFYDWKPLPAGVAKGVPNFCYSNAAMLAASDPSLTYVEGKALGVIPMNHAWCVTREGVVVDPTWVDREMERAYLGVPVSLKYYNKHTHPSNASVLDNWMDGWPILRAKPQAYLPKAA